MQATSQRRLQVQQYYCIAPGIVTAISKRLDAAEIWRKLWKSYLHPAVVAIESGENQSAYHKYRAMMANVTMGFSGPMGTHNDNA